MSAALERLERIRQRHPPPGRPLRVAVIGTGIAGETALYCMTRPQHRHLVDVVRVYEARQRPGLHDNSIVIDGNHRIDVPLRAVSPHYYNNLTKLYRLLGVTLQPVDYSFSTERFETTDTSSPSSSCGFHYRNVSLPWWLGGLSIPWPVSGGMHAFRIVRDLLFLTVTGSMSLRVGNKKGKASPSAESLGSYLTRHRYSSEFIHEFLYPMLSTMLSCSYAQVEQYPAVFVIEFFCTRGTALFAQWFRVANGVEEVSEKLLADVPQGVVSYSTSVDEVRYDEATDSVMVRDASGEEAWFDVVIVATEAAVVPKLWRDVSPEEAAFLQSLDSYQARITVHRDASLMPSRRLDWRGMNLFFTPPGVGPFAASMTSAWLQKFHPALQGIATRRDKEREEDGNDSVSAPLFETWNCFREPLAGTVISDVVLSRAVWHTRTKDAYDRGFIRDVQGRRGIFLIGSYAEPGLTLLEQAVTSGLRVAKLLGCTLPFEVQPAFVEPHWPLWTTLSACVFYGWTAWSRVH